MQGERKNGMQCAEFEGLIADAIDQVLAGDTLERFQAHARVCSNCGPMFSEVEAGQKWLESLEEIDPPAHLVHNILVATTGIETSRVTTARANWLDRLRGWVTPVFNPVLATARQPRFAMSFGMAFFSLSIALSAAGVKPGDLRHVDLRPSAVKRTYYETSGRVVKYYENIRFVYEIESRVREFKRATTPAEPAPEENKQRKNNNDTSGQPEQRQERNYSQGENQPVMASMPEGPPVVTVTTNRRSV